MANLARCLALLWWGAWAAGQCSGHREHKVHNIVLYPDKESWCKTTPIKQVVTWASCLPQELDNNVCVGACFSYMVPHSEPSAPGDLIRPYCDSCQPLDSIWHTVTLQCRDKEGAPTTMQKKVQIITNCSCSSCAESERIKPDLNSLLQSLELESARRLDEVAAAPPAPPGPDPADQLQQQPPPQQQTSRPDPPPVRPAPEAADNGSAPDGPAAETAASPAPQPAQSSLPAPQPGAIEPTEAPAEAGQQQRPQHELPDLLLDPHLGAGAKPDVAGQDKHGDRLLHFFKQLNDPNWAAEKLAKLGSLDRLDKLDKLATEEAGAKELLAKLSELLHKYRQTEEASAQSDESHESEEEEQLQQQAPQTQQHEVEESVPSPSPSSAPSPPPLPAELPKDEDDEEVPSLQDQQLRVAASLLHRTGPHHSLVLDAGVKEKIDVDSHYLQPALAGQEISYHDNLLLDKAKKKDF